MKTDHIYLKYTESLQNLKSDPSIFTNFKSNACFTHILEHTSFDFGLQYKKLIVDEFGEDPKNFLDIINLNDSIGNPVKYDFDGVVMSPSNLRYIYHALLIKSKCEKWFPGKETITIVEIGGGYGGLCLYLKNIFKGTHIDYTIVDLPEPSNLQNRFLQETKQNNAISIHGSLLDTLAKNKFDLVISNYCISEIGRENQEEYFRKLVIHCDKKFFIWNYLTRQRKFFFFKSFDIDFINKEEYCFEEERPLTGRFNKFIYSRP